MAQILFKEVPKKKLRKLPDRPKLGEANYYDVEYLKDLLEKVASPEDIYRVKLVKTLPYPAYRMTIFRHYKNIRKNVNSSILQPGWYVLDTWFAERVNTKEFVFTPSFPEGVDNA